MLARRQWDSFAPNNFDRHTELDTDDSSSLLYRQSDSRFYVVPDLVLVQFMSRNDCISSELMMGRAGQPAAGQSVFRLLGLLLDP